MKFYTPLVALIALVTGAILLLAAPVKPPPPNIVFVFADQWRACSTGDEFKEDCLNLH